MIDTVKSYGSNILALCADGYLWFLNSLEMVTPEIMTRDSDFIISSIKNVDRFKIFLGF
ncbi:hypothetical protein HanRHA438_Chr04g0163711 [Helianthus annuus]|nr:hypothetical protein HanIR_Chr04g0165431 [Helianthus annuus]KAJ0925792.1 hypothetical protein HanRHA438_Chr04g0163711 [Helianthus annuus]